MKTGYAYYRVSTERQGKSGLGLDAQQQAVRAFCQSNGYALAGEFIEIESGKRNNRPVLGEALAVCKKQRATLLIAKLDRLGRNVGFITRLMEAKVDFKAVDNPDADKVVVHVMAVFAEHERDMISKRTKAALEAAKKRGVELGANGKYVLSRLNHENAVRFAEKMSPVIEGLRQQGMYTIQAITDELNRLGVPTFREHHHRWHPATVHYLIKRIKNQSI
ncbi:resolvase [Chitinophagaceae bacterium IBVUCB1]|nr:resolvase [Chitinophagaceae bacterium IBVUCB1]